MPWLDLKEVKKSGIKVWATDINYIPLRIGFLYPRGWVVDLFLAGARCSIRKLSPNSLDKEFCLEALEIALTGGESAQMFHLRSGRVSSRGP